MAGKRTIIIGLDGVPYSLLKTLSEKGIMPHTRALIAKSTFTEMYSSLPEVSSVAWSSIITGKNPAEHGIFGFTDFPLGTYRLSFPNFSHLKAPTFWENDAHKRAVILNVPSTYPARSLNGVLVSGFVALDLERAVYPSSALAALKNMEYRIDVDSAKAHESLELFLTDLKKTHASRIAAYRFFWNQAWDTFMLVFTGTDRLMHFLWEAWEDEQHRYHEEFLDYFRAIDAIIGEIVSNLNDEDDLLMLSDHGFEKLQLDIHINYFLKEQGFLKLGAGQQPAFSSLDYGTKAFALDPARIYIHLKDKYPRGTVELGDRETILGELEQLFGAFELNNKKVIKHMYRKEEIYSGPYLNQAPDLLLIGNEGFNLKAALGAESLSAKGVFTGKHTYHDAFLLINRDSKYTLVAKKPSVSDVVTIMNKLKGGM